MTSVTGNSNDSHSTTGLNLGRVTDSVPALIHTAEPDGYLDYFNRPWLEYVGLRLEDLQGWKWTACIHPDELDGILEKWRASLASGEPFLHEARVRRADGKYRWMLHHKVALRDEKGEIVKWYGSSLDIEERKTAEEQLRRNAQELQRSEFYLAEGQRLAHVGSWAFGPDGFVYWSPELFRMYGLDPASKPPSVQEYLDRVHPHDRESMADLIKGILAKPSTFDTTKRIVRPNGELRYIRCAGAPAVENQSLKKYVGSAIDVTEHELLTQELRRREAYLAEAQRLSHTGSFGWKPDTGELIWSAETYRIFEYDQAVTPTLDLLVQRVHPEDRADFQAVIERVSRGASDFEHAYRLLLPDGRTKYVHALAHATQDAFGRREFVGAVTDITKRKRAEQHLIAQHTVTQALAESGTLEEVAPKILQAVCECLTWDLGELWCTDQAKGVLRCVEVWHKKSIEAAQFAAFSQECIFLPGIGLPGRVWSSLEPAYIPDVVEDLNFPRASAAARAGLHAAFAFPIVLGGEFLGVMAFFSHEIRQPDQDLLNMMTNIGSQIGQFVERRRVEEDLRRSEAYLAEAQELSHTGSWAWSPEAGIKYLSEEWYRVMGFDPRDGLPGIEEFIQRAHPDDQVKLSENHERAIRDKLDVEIEFRIVHPSGALRHINGIGHPVLSPSGDLIEFIGTVIDITERKRAEETLRQSEAYLAEAQRLSQTGSWAWNPNPDKDIRYWSEECYRVLGFDPAGPLPRFEEFFKKIHPDDQALSRERFDQAIRSKADWELDYRIVHPDKGVRDIHVVGHAVLDPSGELVEFVGTVIDITERKRAEQELQQLVDLVPQLIAVVAPDGKFIYANRVSREYSGLTVEEFRSVDVTGRIVHPDDLEKVRAERKVGLAGIDPFEYEARMRGKDGIYRWFLIRYNPLIEAGQTRKWYATATEIESRKQEEERVRQENVRLEERTRIAQELHDTLLQSFNAATMKLWAAMAGLPSDSTLKPKIDPILDLMEHAIAEGRTAIQGLRSSDCGTPDLVAALSGIRRELVVPPDVDFRVSVVGQQRLIPAPVRQELYRIGKEALVNAFRHSRARRIELELEYTGDDLSMRVRDNGCGIDPLILEKRPERHWGLAGMRERAARIGGQLKISSSATAGTEIRVSIPSKVAFQLSLADAGELRV